MTGSNAPLGDTKPAVNPVTRARDHAERAERHLREANIHYSHREAGLAQAHAMLAVYWQREAHAQPLTRDLTKAECECENPTRASYYGRHGRLHCEQCDGLWPETQ